MDKYCLSCGDLFNTIWVYKLYCSVECKRRESNKKRYLRQTACGKERKRLARERISKIKSDSGCKDCGERHPACLQFHHRNPEEKTFTIAHAISLSFGLTRILNEIKKCDIMCANCHLKYHYENPVSTKIVREGRSRGPLPDSAPSPIRTTCFYNIICVFCGRKAIRKASSAIYCSKKCSRSARYRRKNELDTSNVSSLK